MRGAHVDINERRQVIERLHAFPDQLAILVDGLTTEQLTTAYEPGEWTVAQNVHHVFDAHVIFYTRCKQIAFEDAPPLVNMDENGWAELPDAKAASLTPALAGIAYVQGRLVAFLEHLTEAEWQRAGVHAERGAMTIATIAAYAARHGELHLAQIRKTLTAGSIVRGA